MTLTTITTIGYQELRPLSHAGRVFNTFLILFGVSGLFVSFGAMTQTIIELELQDLYGKRRKKRMINRLHDHFTARCFSGRPAAEIKTSSCGEEQFPSLSLSLFSRRSRSAFHNKVLELHDTPAALPLRIIEGP